MCLLVVRWQRTQRIVAAYTTANSIDYEGQSGQAPALTLTGQVQGGPYVTANVARDCTATDITYSQYRLINVAIAAISSVSANKKVSA